MSRFMLAYVERKSPIHALSGTTKFAFFLLWSILAMTTYDTRVMLVMVVLSLVLFAISKTKLEDVSFVFKILVFFMLFNLVTVYLFSPEEGVRIYGSRHVLFRGFGRYTATSEQLFYEFNIFLKYGMVVPVAILLMVTTQPSEFASSLNKAGLSYSVSYAISLTLRYIPDVQREYQDIARAQQARGIELSRKTSWIKRLKGAAAILMPLVFSSLERIDVISHAMELRGFGKRKRRTWYSGKPFRKRDCAVLAATGALFVLGMWITFHDGDRFYNPFRGRV
jgi:energy-coupling factor transport system permease protein